MLGILLIPANTYWMLSMEKVHSGPYPSVISLFLNTIFILAIVAGLNFQVRRIAPRFALSMAEMLIIYTMTAISTALAGHDMLPSLVATMSYPWQAANESNNWTNTFIPHLPKWLHVSNADVIKPLYEGNSSLYANGYWTAWVMPALGWISFFTAIILVMTCMNTLMRKQWVDHERLTFPIVQLPIAMTEPNGEMWRSKLFWTAFGITFGIELINGLSLYFPAIPMFNMTERGHDLGTGLTTTPWKAIGWMPYSFYPFVIGLGYLLPADLSFSVWFFYLFWKVEKVADAMLGGAGGFDAPYIRHQEFGGAMALVVVLLWTSRGYLKQVWLRIAGKKSELDDSQEPVSYRIAALGILLGFVYLLFFMGAVGMSPLIVVIAFLIYFMLAIAVARIRAELGPPIHDMPFTPDYVITTTAGIARLAPGDLVGLAYFSTFHGAYRSHPMPIGIEGMKMASVTGASQRKFFCAIMIAAVLGAAATFWAYLHLGYSLGLDTKWNAGAAWAWSFTSRLSQWWSKPPDLMKPDAGAGTAVGAGFLFCLFLSYMRTSLLGWPFHPIGYVISGTYQANLVWMPLMIAWAIKVCILKYGGLKTFKTAIPFFLGLIVGELMMGCLWGVIGMVFDIPYYNFFGA